MSRYRAAAVGASQYRTPWPAWAGRVAAFACLCGAGLPAAAQPRSLVDGAGRAAADAAATQNAVELQRQRAREQALRERQEQAGERQDAPTPQAPLDARLGDESPCQLIREIELEGEEAERFRFALAAAAGPKGDDEPRGRCLGGAGIDLVITRIQHALSEAGWITTRVLAGPQDLRSGVLRLTVLPGRLSAYRRAPAADFEDMGADTTRLEAAFPMRPGDLVRLDAIEQGLENLQHVPSARAQVRVDVAEHAQAPGESDLLVSWRRESPLRAEFSADNSGSYATGRGQGTATLSWDDPLGRNDLLYLSLACDIFASHGRGTESQTLHYDIPLGYWKFAATGSKFRYHQTIAGPYESFHYSGNSDSAELEASRVVLRTLRHRSTVGLRGFRRSTEHFIEQVNTLPQGRVEAGWGLWVAHRAYLDAAQLDLRAEWKRGTGAFGAVPAPEEREGRQEGVSHFQMATLDASVSLPFQLAEQRLRYSAQYRRQWNRTPLTPMDRLAMGGRYTVRGFDGEQNLLGDAGWLLRQELGTPLGASGVELYTALDAGGVHGPSTYGLDGRHLAGGGLGLRGNRGAFRFDLFVGAPLRKPPGFVTAKAQLDFTLSLSF